MEVLPLERLVLPMLAPAPHVKHVICRTCGMAAEFEFVQPLTESDGIEHIGYDPDFMESVLQAMPKSA
jgi:hypothetical protein